LCLFISTKPVAACIMTAKQTLPNNNDISLFQTCGPYRRESTKNG